MTMPHLMNCAHSMDGWCLDCVNKLHQKNTFLINCLLELEQAAHNPADCFPELCGLADRYELLVEELGQMANRFLVEATS